MKELLEQLAAGTTTVDDVLKAIDDSDKDKVPRSRLNDKISEVKDLEGELSKRNEQLEQLSSKAQGNEQLTDEINKLKQANEQQAQEYEGKLKQQAFDAKLAEALSAAKVRNPKAVKALLDADNIKLDGEKLLGLDDQLSALKESDAYLFASEEKPALGGRTPHTPNGQSSTGLTKEDFRKMSYTERVALFDSDPENYNKLKGE